MTKKILAVFCSLFLLANCAGKTKVADNNGMGGSDYSEVSSSEYLADGVSNKVLFAYDSSEIDQEGKDVLQKQADWIKANPSVSLLIEGHCDERGTREYNLALGERRADMVKRFLVAQGVESSRLETISYGKERLAMLGDSEEVHHMNRRSVTVVKK